MERDGVAFAPPQQWRRESSVHGRGDCRLTGKIHRQRANLQIEFSPGQHGTRIACGRRLGGRSPAKVTHTDGSQRTACEPLDKAPP